MALLLTSKQENDRVHDAPAGTPWNGYAQESYDAAQRNQTLGFVALGIGVVAVGVGIYFLATSGSGHPRAAVSGSAQGKRPPLFAVAF